MSEIVTLELKQSDSQTVIQNGEWVSTIATAQQLNDGDSLIISKSFIDTTSQSDSKILIPYDIRASMSFYIYTTSTEQRGLTNVQQGKHYVGIPARVNVDKESQPDGKDYVFGSNKTGGSFPAYIKHAKSIKVYSIEKNSGVSYMGGGDPVNIHFTNSDGQPSYFQFKIPRKHIPTFGRVSQDIEVSFVYDTRKPVQGDSAWDAPQRLDGQNTNPNRIDVTSDTPTDNYIQPTIAQFLLNIPKGSYSAMSMVALLNEQFQNNPTDSLYSNDLLIRSGHYSDLKDITCTDSTANTYSVRIMTPSMETAPDPADPDVRVADFWLGSSQVNMDFNPDTSSFLFKYLHMPLYNETGDVISTYYTDDEHNTLYYAGKTGGITIHDFTCTINDTRAGTKNGQYFDFWSGMLGFDHGILCANHSMTTVPLLIGGDQYLYPLYNNFSKGLSTTTARSTIDNLIDKATTPALVPVLGSYDNTVDLTTTITATNSVLNPLSLDYGYFMVEITGGFSTQMIGSTELSHNISSIVNRYYSLGSYTSGDESSSVIYTHRGSPLYLKDFKIRILDSDRNVAQNLDADNTIYVQVIKSNQITN